MRINKKAALAGTGTASNTAFNSFDSTLASQVIIDCRGLQCGLKGRNEKTAEWGISS